MPRGLKFSAMRFVFMAVNIKSAVCWDMAGLMPTDGYVGQPTQLCSVTYQLRHPAHKILPLFHNLPRAN